MVGVGEGGGKGDVEGWERERESVCRGFGLRIMQRKKEHERLEGLYFAVKIVQVLLSTFN